jgi:hypothetical protein
MTGAILSVAIPIWKMSDIAWIAFESLINQQNIDFEWELIIAEESEEAFGLKGIGPYKDRLKKVGCTNIKYIELSSWVPLSKKWLLMADAAAPTSQHFLLHGADSYSPSLRLKETYDIFESTGCDWVDTDHSYWYEIKLGEYFYWYAPPDCRIQKPIPRCMYMATRTPALRKIHQEYLGDMVIDPDKRSNLRGFPRSSVDKWMCSLLRKNNPDLITKKNESDNWKTGLETNGCNKISTTRPFYMQRKLWPFNHPPPESRSIIESRYTSPLLNRLKIMTEFKNEKS